MLKRHPFLTLTASAFVAVYLLVLACCTKQKRMPAPRPAAALETSKNTTNQLRRVGHEYFLPEEADDDALKVKIEAEDRSRVRARFGAPLRSGPRGTTDRTPARAASPLPSIGMLIPPPIIWPLRP